MTTAGLDSTAKRLGYAVQRSSLNASQVSREMGMSRSTISSWITGRRKGPDSDECRKLGLILKVNPQWLAMLSDEMDPSAAKTSLAERTSPGHTSGKDLRTLPLCGGAAAGEPMAAIYEATDVQWFDFSESFLRSMYKTRPDPERAVMMRVDGKSMQGALPHGTLVFIDRGPRGEGFETVNRKDIYMVRPPGEEGVTLKRVAINGDGSHRTLVLMPTWKSLVDEADDYDVRTYPLKPGVRIQSIIRGRVVGKFELVGSIGKVM